MLFGYVPVDMEWLLLLLRAPFDLVASVFEVLYQLPGAWLTVAVLALVPLDTSVAATQLARQYPLITLVALVVTWLCWYVLSGLLSTLCWLLYRGPLLWMLGRLLWQLGGHWITRRWRVDQAGASLQASLQQHAQQAAQLLMRRAFDTETKATELPK